MLNCSFNWHKTEDKTNLPLRFDAVSCSAIGYVERHGWGKTLIRIETKAGHGAGKPTSKQIEEAADIWSFIMYNLGMKFK